MEEFNIISRSLSDTMECATCIASILKIGDLVILEGSLATGKTQFTKMCCEALGYKDLVTSPSFTLANFYSLPAFSIMHVDFYRIENEHELLDLGIEGYLENSITFIEWGDKFQDDFGEFLKIKFEFLDEINSFRKLTFSYKGCNWTEKFNAIRKVINKEK